MIDSQPIIITGMHRSGTSFLAKILIKNNVYMGSKLDPNHESVFFQRLNKWILSCIGSSWDNPQSLRNLSRKDTNIIIDRLNNVLKNRLSKSLYFGKANLIKNHSFDNINFLWGWKDPSNTFTIPIWKKIFPKAKVINIIRHPLDVSTSLLKREEKLKKMDIDLFLPKFISSFIPLISVSKGDVLSSFNIKNHDDCLFIYKKYLDEMSLNNSKYNRIFNINYESLILNPESILYDLFHFLEVDFNERNLQNIVGSLNTSRVNVYKKKNIIYDKELLNSIDYELFS